MHADEVSTKGQSKQVGAQACTVCSRNAPARGLSPCGSARWDAQLAPLRRTAGCSPPRDCWPARCRSTLNDWQFDFFSLCMQVKTDVDIRQGCGGGCRTMHACSACHAAVPMPRRWHQQWRWWRPGLGLVSPHQRIVGSHAASSAGGDDVQVGLHKRLDLHVGAQAAGSTLRMQPSRRFAEAGDVTASDAGLLQKCTTRWRRSGGGVSSSGGMQRHTGGSTLTRRMLMLPPNNSYRRTGNPEGRGWWLAT